MGPERRLASWVWVCAGPAITAPRPPVCTPRPTALFLSKSLPSSRHWGLCLQQENNDIPPLG